MFYWGVVAVLPVLAWVRYRWPPLIDQLCNVKTDKDIIAAVRRCARNSDPLPVAVDCFQKNIHRLTDDVLKTYSELHKRYSTNLGLVGYSINVLWAAIVSVHSLP